MSPPPTLTFQLQSDITDQKRPMLQVKAKGTRTPRARGRMATVRVAKEMRMAMQKGRGRQEDRGLGVLHLDMASQPTTPTTETSNTAPINNPSTHHSSLNTLLSSHHRIPTSHPLQLQAKDPRLHQ